MTEAVSEKPPLLRFMDDLTARFGGCSNEGITKGQWIDPADATRYQDETIRVSVVCDRVLLNDAPPSSDPYWYGTSPAGHVL
jgi:hypothetical protein